MTRPRDLLGPRLAGPLRRTAAPLLAGLLFAALRDAADGLAIAAGSLLAPLAPIVGDCLAVVERLLVAAAEVLA